MSSRVQAIAVAALGAIMLSGCSAGPASSGASASPSATTSELSARAALISYACDYMKDPAATVRGLGRDLSERGKYPDVDTAAYAAQNAISEGCPQYADR